MTHITASAAYGRDYKSQKAIRAAWIDGLDFELRDFMPPKGWIGGRYFNIDALDNLKANGITEINIRYKADRSVYVMKI